MRQILKGQLFIGLAFFLCFSSAHAKNLILADNPALKTAWYTLNYYHKKGSAIESEIINDSYFIANDGRTNPQSELNHFRNLLIQKNKTADTIKTLCRFPARTTLVINSDKSLTLADRPICKDYIARNNPQNIKSISLILASGYFDNPSSYFGHNLLKFNYQDHVINQTKLDSSLNYGAKDTSGDAMPLYVAKGLLGGYKAAYQRNSHFVYSHHYTNGQIRDLWEYELELTTEQIQLISEHSWELLNAEFTYFFFNDNCAHRIIKLIEIATGKNLSSTHGIWLLPIQIVRKLNKDDKKTIAQLVRKEHYHPSLKTIFSNKYTHVTSQERKRFLRFFSTKDARQKQTILATLKPHELLLALDYLDLKAAQLTLKSKAPHKTKEIESQRALILFELLKKPANEVTENSQIRKPGSLLNSKPPSFIRAGYKNKNGQDLLKIHYRAANNDLLNTPNPGQGVSKFIMGAFAAEFKGDNIDITDITLVDIINLNTNPLPMAMTNEFSWGFKLNYGARNNSCHDCSNLGVEAKVGKANRISDNILLYSLAGGRIHTPSGERNEVGTALLENGTIINLGELLNLHAEVDFHYFPRTDQLEHLLRAGISLTTGKSHDLRFSLEGNGDESAFIASFGYYFD